MFVFQRLHNPYCSLDKNDILVFEDNPFTSINFRTGDAGFKLRNWTGERIENNNDFIT